MKLVVFETDEWEKAAFQRLQPFTPAPLNGQTAASYAVVEAVTTFVNSELRAYSRNCLRSA